MKDEIMDYIKKRWSQIEPLVNRLNIDGFQIYRTGVEDGVELLSPSVSEEEIQQYITECEETYGRPASLAIEIGICWIMDKLNTKS